MHHMGYCILLRIRYLKYTNNDYTQLPTCLFLWTSFQVRCIQFCDIQDEIHILKLNKQLNITDERVVRSVICRNFGLSCVHFFNNHIYPLISEHKCGIDEVRLHCSIVFPWDSNNLHLYLCFWHWYINRWNFEKL